MELDREEIAKHYDVNPKKEWERLKVHPFEFAISCHFIEKYIGKNDSILDIGGGPGRYSIHFAKEGHKVSLLDISKGNIVFAKKKARQYKVKIDARVGDALSLPYEDSSFNAVILFGPMYHLLEEDERKKALKEATRVLKPNGYLFVSFISLSGGMVFEMRECPNDIISPIDQEVFWPCLLSNKPFHGKGFTLVTFDTPESVLALMNEPRLKKVTLFGQESILSPCEDKIKKTPKEVREMWTKEAIALAEKEEFFSFSEHLCYIAKKQ